MLTCLPQSICSWNFYIQGAAEGPGEVTFNMLTEQGNITLGNRKFSIEKQGWLSGHWILKNGEGIWAQARKPSAMFRSFELEAQGGKFTCEAQSAFGRAFHFLREGRTVGEIRPVHAFTRRSVIECDPSLPESAVLFSFWLAVLTWKRAASNNNASS